MTGTPVYLDYQATTPIDPQVRTAMMPFLEDLFGNPHSIDHTGRAPTYGDTRCIVLGHLTRMAVWALRDDWERFRPTAEKIAAVRERRTSYGDPDRLALGAPPAEPHEDLPLFSRRTTGIGDEAHGAVS